jgi:hypothetical protein
MNWLALVLIAVFTPASPAVFAEVLCGVFKSGSMVCVAHRPGDSDRQFCAQISGAGIVCEETAESCRAKARDAECTIFTPFERSEV